MNTLDDFDGDVRLGIHLRRTLHAVADTIPDTSADAAVTHRVPGRRPPARRRALALVAVIAVGLLGLLGWKAFNPDAIVRIPTESALMSGSAEHGGEWWLFPAQVMSPDHMSECDPIPSGATFVSAASNKPGDEMNAGGVVYGESTASVCTDDSSFLANPARFSMGSTRLGPSDDGGDESTAWGYFAAVHPTVTEIRVTADEAPAFVVATEPLPERPDGARFAAFTTSPDTQSVTTELLTAKGATVIQWTQKMGG